MTTIREKLEALFLKHQPAKSAYYALIDDLAALYEPHVHGFDCALCRSLCKDSFNSSQEPCKHEPHVHNYLSCKPCLDLYKKGIGAGKIMGMDMANPCNHELLTRVRVENAVVRNMSSPMLTEVLDRIVDAICSLAIPKVSEPSREALVMLLGELGRSKESTFYCAQDSFEKWIARFMSWATGGKKDRRWCSHCVWDVDGDFETAQQSYKEPHFCFQEPGFKPTPVRSNWTVCPICATPRPKEEAGE